MIVSKMNNYLPIISIFFNFIFVVVIQ